MSLPVLPHTPTTLSALVGVAASRLPTRAAANLAAAHWSVETAGGSACYGLNMGNLTCAAAPHAPCGTHPLVTAPLTFAIFGSLGAGADAYLAFIRAHGGYTALVSGDVNAYASALAAMGYAGAGMPVSTYAAQLQGWLPKAQAVVLPPSGGGPSTLDGVVLAGVAGIVGMFVASWAAEGFKRPRIPPIWGRA